MKRKSLWVFLLAAYACIVIPLAGHLRDRPVVVKLGYTPEASVLKVVTGDQRYAVSELTILKVLFYFGSLVEEWQNQIVIPPEYFNMFRTVETAVQLDPYNMDAYYFAQAAFTWEIGHAADVNRLLDYGMQYRTWDWYLPFFAGFNAAYFLKDFDSAAGYMQKAAEITGDQLFTNLAARYFYEAGRSDFGVRFLDTMIERATDRKVKEVYQLRKEALLAVRAIEAALADFQGRYERLPGALSELVTAGLLPTLPKDPYGGEFLLDDEGKVRSTSKFALRAEPEKAPSE